MPDIGFGPAWTRYLQGAGLLNSDFVDGPPGELSEITSGNLLPYWTLVNPATLGMKLHLVADTASGSGHILRLTVDGSVGSGGDLRGIEQIVRIHAGRGQAWVYAPIVTTMAGSGVANSLHVKGQYLRSDRTTATGSESDFEELFTVLGAGPIDLIGAAEPVPTDAAYLRLRIVGERAATGSIDITEIRLLQGPSQYFLADELAGFPAGLMEQREGRLYLGSNGQRFTDGLSSGPSNSAVVLAGRRVAMRQADLNLLTAAGDQIQTTGGEFCTLEATTPLTLTSTPTVNSGDDGQFVTLVNIGSNSITVQDQGTLGSSGLRLSTTTFAMGTRDSLQLLYSADIGDWLEVGRTNVL